MHGPQILGSTLSVSNVAAPPSNRHNHKHRVCAQHPLRSPPSPCSAFPCSRPPGPKTAPPRHAPRTQRPTAATPHPAARTLASAPGSCAPHGPRPHALHCLPATIVKKPHRPRTSSALQYQSRWGGVAAAIVAIRCAHPSHTQRGACSLLGNANSQTRSTRCSHVWHVSRSCKVHGFGRARPRTKGGHNRGVDNRKGA